MICLAQNQTVPEVTLMRVLRPTADIRLGVKAPRGPFRQEPWVLGEGVAGASRHSAAGAHQAASSGCA
ncbi:MAG: hypothetical protein C7B45_14045 [Sulfobacillus acidophilus]|uniref:Uncharacterized protein n=1 Tax=Sulfobacillus acidophilus TaxID=53633 RepID=A0A2T2WEG0_9FIRM|nr:MAG: hypothetical protein C7B45_14045 [Sulfobacillus acidophilus]